MLRLIALIKVTLHAGLVAGNRRVERRKPRVTGIIAGLLELKVPASCSGMELARGKRYFSSVADQFLPLRRWGGVAGGGKLRRKLGGVTLRWYLTEYCW